MKQSMQQPHDTVTTVQGGSPPSKAFVNMWLQPQLTRPKARLRRMASRLAPLRHQVQEILETECCEPKLILAPPPFPCLIMGFQAGPPSQCGPLLTIRRYSTPPVSSSDPPEALPGNGNYGYK